MTFKVVIPARYHSSRLPGKPLVEIAGVPMVIHVARKAKLSGASEIIIATDDDRIVKTSEEYGFRSIMTNPNHISGTDRIEEVINKVNWASETIIINLQGDEPLIDPLLINQVAEGMIKDKIDYASAASLFSSIDDFSNPNNVKVILDHNDYAVYFSRSMIPYQDLQEKTFPKFSLGPSKIAPGGLQNRPGRPPRGFFLKDLKFKKVKKGHVP